MLLVGVVGRAVDEDYVQRNVEIAIVDRPLKFAGKRPGGRKSRAGVAARMLSTGSPTAA
jgi:hypothetical protein